MSLKKTMSFVMDGKEYATVDELFAELNKDNDKLEKKIGKKRFDLLCEIDNRYHRWIDNTRLSRRPTLVHRLRTINRIVGEGP